MRIHFCGVRGSTPAPGVDFVRYGGQTSCVAVAHEGGERPTLVLDAGSGIQRVTGLLEGEGFRGTIMLSHLHWDHLLGLPFFSGADREDGRTRMLIPDQGNGRVASETIGQVMSPPFFPIEPTQLRGNWTFGTIEAGEREIEGFAVLAREIPHKGGRTFGYRIAAGGSTLAYLPDHCPTMVGAGEDGFGAYHPAAMELVEGADVLVHDAQLLPAEQEAEAAYGHSVADYAVELGRRGGVGEVVLFHHRPNRTDAELDALGERLASEDPLVRVAVEGSAIDL